MMENDDVPPELEEVVREDDNAVVVPIANDKKVCVDLWLHS
jgi:hypothetical protein